MRKKHSGIIFFLLCLVWVGLACPFPAKAGVTQDGDVYTVSDAAGYAPIRDGNKNQARDEAKLEAYRDALEKALGAVITGVTEMENYAVVRDKVFSQTTGIVKSLDIVREWEEDGLLLIEAICKVSVAALDGVLGPAVLDAIGHPRIMVLIDERIGDKTPFISFTEAEALRIFEKAGYLLVDPDQARALISIDPASAYDDPAKIMDAARTLRADVIILGRAYAAAFQTGRVEGITMHGVSGTVQLKAVLTKTAYSITSQTVEASTGRTPALSVETGAERCFKEATPKAAATVVNKIAYALVSGATGIPGGTVNVRITGVTFAISESILDGLGGLAGRSGGVYDRGLNNGLFEIDVVSENSVRTVASFLSESGINITGIDGQIIYGEMDEGRVFMPKSSQSGETVTIRITDVPSFKEAGEIEEALAAFIGQGEIDTGYKDKVLEVKITSEKNRREIASFLSEKGIEITGSTGESIEGKMVRSNLLPMGNFSAF